MFSQFMKLVLAAALYLVCCYALSLRVVTALVFKLKREQKERKGFTKFSVFLFFIAMLNLMGVLPLPLSAIKIGSLALASTQLTGMHLLIVVLFTNTTILVYAHFLTTLLGNEEDSPMDDYELNGDIILSSLALCILVVLSPYTLLLLL